jgi:hypothetical protein
MPWIHVAHMTLVQPARPFSGRAHEGAVRCVRRGAWVAWGSVAVT